MNPADYYNTIPIISLIISILLLVVIEALVKGKTGFMFLCSFCLVIINLTIAYVQFDVTGKAFNDMLSITKLSNLLTIALLSGLLITILFSKNYLAKVGYDFGEFYILVFCSFSGMLLMVAANDLIIVFLSIELMSIPFYILAGFFRKRVKSNEAALKYFLLGAFATGFLLYGLALIYGVSGTTNISIISQKLPSIKDDIIFIIGLGLVIIGISFKIAAFPFHSYAPDVYDGAPTTVSGFFSSVGKASIFGLLVIISGLIIDKDVMKLKEILIFISVASMLIGSIVALVQKNIKRMLAYSSISHAGYILIGIITHTAYGFSAVIFYSVIYIFMQVATFGLVAIIEDEEGNRIKIDDYYGLGKNNPVLAFFLAIMMFSLAGIPPFGGFFAKYYIFMAAVQADLLWLALVGALVSVVSVYFYLNIIQAIYFKTSENMFKLETKSPEIIALIISSLVIILAGLKPNILLEAIYSFF
jgi:NADH-quinone oxidoreductase subunit N